MKKARVCFIGLSHLGQVTSISWCSFFKSPVYALDLDQNLIDDLSKGLIKIPEPGLQELLKKVKSNYIPTSDFKVIENCNLIFITLDTPTLKPNSLKELDDLINLTLSNIKPSVDLIILSQVPVGFCHNLENYIKEKYPKLKFNLYYFVNTLIVGEALSRFLQPERIIIGSDDKRKPISRKVKKYLNKFNCPILHMSCESAEMTKSAINLFLAAHITAANTLANYCEIFEADIYDIIPALKSDKRIGQFAYVKPTLRISGGHIERELIRLNNLDKKNSDFSKFMLNANEKQFYWLSKKIENTFTKKRKPVICLWGLSYKKNTQSTNNAISLKFIKKFSKKLIINAYDPEAEMPKQIKDYIRFNDKYTALKKADCLIVLTDWDEFKNIDIPKIKSLMRKKIIIDCVGILYDKKNKLKDFKYICLGVG